MTNQRDRLGQNGHHWQTHEMEDHLSRFRLVLNEINAESSRGRVMVATAMIDDLLGQAIAARLVNDPVVAKLLDGFNAPLGSLSARIVAALGLGVISKQEFDDLEIIRKIRNDFAHRTGVKFTDATVRDRANLLRMAAQEYGDVSVSAEGRFTSAAVALILHLTNRAHYVSLKRLEHEPWLY